MSTRLTVAICFVVASALAMLFALRFGGRDAGELGFVCMLAGVVAWKFFVSVLRASYNGWLYGGVAKDVLQQAKREGLL